ncbi:hypothetical protein CP557_20405 [Natrinema ejinorense]|uniref:Uncharacterized protein n=1 Tax=Natrinema ejinorense TaxID=373386 RepID=A0A2A5QPZ1_9EURY|nr:hypothetical protein CP557_20405 [Natrinema ejinorense]
MNGSVLALVLVFDRDRSVRADFRERFADGAEVDDSVSEIDERREEHEEAVLLDRPRGRIRGASGSRRSGRCPRGGRTRSRPRPWR